MPPIIGSVTRIVPPASNTSATYTFTVTADENGINVGDVGVLQVMALGTDSIGSPIVASVADSLANTWGSPVTEIVAEGWTQCPGLGIGDDVSKQQGHSVVTATMATAVEPGGTFTITFAMNNGFESFAVIQAVAFVNISGVTVSGASHGSGGLGGGSSTFSSGASGSGFEQSALYISFAAAVTPITAQPSGWMLVFDQAGTTQCWDDGSTIWGYYGAYIQAASLTNTAPNLVSDTWTQSSAAGYSAICLGFSISAPTITSDIVTDICLRAGLTSGQIDVSRLTNANIFGGSTTVLGYLVERPTPAAEILKPLMQAYFFDGCESSGAMRWVPRGMASALTIPESDMGLLSDGAKVKPEQIAQEQDLPLAFTVLYNDIALDYQQGSQQRTRSSRVKKTKQQTIISLPIVMTASQALQIAEAALYLAWLERNSYTFNLGSPKYMQLDPTDVVQFVYEGLTFQMRIVENSMGQGFAVMLSGVNEDARNFLSSLSAPLPVSFNPAPIRLVGSSVLFLFDIPLLQDSDANPGGTGFYFAMGSAVNNWTGGVLYDSSDDSTFAQDETTNLNPVFGSCTTTLGAPREPWELDTVNTLTVQPVNGAPAGVSMLDMLNGANAFIVGSEIIQAQNVVDNGDGTYTLSNLFRGRRGTEWACGTHAANESFVMPSTGAQRVQNSLGVIGQTNYYKGATVGQDPSAVASQTFTIAGADLKPYAPCHIGGTADGSGNITVTWLRRTRIGGEADWADGVADVPLSEDSEAYDVDVLNGGTVVRTFTGLPAATCYYSAAQQTADFGSVQSSVTVNVYQKSAQVGRGYKGTGVAPTPGGWPVPVPLAAAGYGQFYINGS